jgi:hypothetical protein
MTASDLEVTRIAHLWSAARRRRNRPQALAIRYIEKDYHPDPMICRRKPASVCTSRASATHSGFLTIYYQIG